MTGLIGIAGLTRADAMLREPCDCELPGEFHTGVSGILAALEDERVGPETIVERCDQCRRFDSDAAALARLVESGLAEPAIADRSITRAQAVPGNEGPPSERRASARCLCVCK